MSGKFIACPSCGRNRVTNLGEIPAFGYFAGRKLTEPLSGGSLFRCDSCWLYFRYPKLDNMKLDELYRQGSSDNWQHTISARSDWVTALDWISTLSVGRSVLDVGCFDGGFLSRLGSDYDLSGIEIHEGAAQAAEQKGIRIIAPSYRFLEEVDENFDIVTSFDVIEHVDDPLFFLKMISSITRPGGAVIISTGNTDAMSWRFMGSRYWYCTISEHISFINPRWCDIAASNLGLRVERIEKFSHLAASTPMRIADLGKNMLYRVAPAVVAWLRTKGFGGIDVNIDPSLIYAPPNWMSATDHFMVLFRKE